MKKVLASGVIIASLVFWAGIVSAENTNVTTTVGATAGPWQWVNGGLNTAYQYDIGAPGPFTAPSVISATNGLRFSVGDSLTISYVSGLIAAGSDNWPFVDANGVTNRPMNDGYLGRAPSNYMDPATYPIYVVELVGTFADSSGQIVGTPFAIGDLGTFTIPAGATRLQLGVNDNWLYDDLGSWTIQVAGPAIPEPTTAALVLMSLVGFGLVSRRH